MFAGGSSAKVAVHQLEQLVIGTCGVLGPLPDGIAGAMSQVMAEQLPADAAQRLLHGRHLGDDVGTIPILVHHALQPSHLALDALQAPDIAGASRSVGVATARLGGGSRGSRSLRQSALPFRAHARLSRKLLDTTLTELSAMAALAMTGLSRMPKAG
jgi:hypothetical protein